MTQTDKQKNRSCVNLTRACVLEKRYCLTLLTPLLTVVLLLTSCNTFWNPPHNNSQSSPPVLDSGDLTGQVHIVGSTALLPLAAKAVDLFHQRHPNVEIDAQGGGSITGLKAVTSYQADIGDSDISADPALYPNADLTDHIVCMSAFTLIVNPQVTVASLTTQQVIDIFTGVTTNWEEVGGSNLPITAVIRPASSGTKAVFRHYVLGGLEETGKPLVSDSNTTVVDAVAHTPGAIGYVTIAVLNPLVKPVGLDGTSATEQNILAGRYTFWSFEHMYTLQNGVNATTAFLDFMQTPEIQRLAQNLGYIPVSHLRQ